MRPFLSICIPTYNRGEIVNRTVRNILKSEREDIEVVASNNCSTDKTEELLLSIEDERFHYFKNKYNNGTNNLVSVLTYATGEYLLLISDEDEVVLKNLDSYIKTLKKERPAVMLGSAAVNRNRYVNNGEIYAKKGYEALKAFGFGNTYMSGYIFNNDILKIILDGTYGTEINRKFGYAYNFVDLTRRMLQYGNFMTKAEIITTQREHGKRDMGIHFDGGTCAYAPEYKVENFYDAVNDLCNIKITQHQKYKLLEQYKMEIVFNRSLSDYLDTYTGKALRQANCEGEMRIAAYYRENTARIKGMKFYTRLYKNIKDCNSYIEKSGVFQEKYAAVKCKYAHDTWNIFVQYYKKLREFTCAKIMLETK